MPINSFGEIFTATTFGESHGKAVGVVVDGCPAGLPLDETDIQPQLDRRRPGQSRYTTPRDEPDSARILSGIRNGVTSGGPIAVLVENKDSRPDDYDDFIRIPRPSHADYTYFLKYGQPPSAGGGRASARETIGRVIAGAVAEKFLATCFKTEIVAWVSSIGDISIPFSKDLVPSREMVDKTPLRCPDYDLALKMADLVEEVKKEKDSIGGTITCLCTKVPPGLGEPVFDKLEARLASAMMSIPAAKGFEIGSGFYGSRMRGSEHNDLFVKKGDLLGTLTNYSGGIQGGISNGEPIYFRVAFKPTSTIGKAQQTADFSGKAVLLEAKGRHDPCVVPRAVPIVEAMTALVLADLILMNSNRRLDALQAFFPDTDKA